MKLLRIEQQFGDITPPERKVMQYLLSRNPNLKMDSFGNLYLIKKGLPLLSSHMDTVQTQSEMSKLNTIKLKGGIIKGDSIRIGADDKLGIALAMQTYEDLNGQVSLLFTRQEETGLQGARAFVEEHLKKIKQVPYILTLDRKGDSNIVGSPNKYCSREFAIELEKYVESLGYTDSTGGTSDCNVYADHINTVNLSVGYYGHHTTSERIIVKEAEGALEVIKTIVQNVKGKFPIYKDSKMKAKPSQVLPAEYKPSAWTENTRQTIFDFVTYNPLENLLTFKKNIEIMPEDSRKREHIQGIKAGKYTVREIQDEVAYNGPADYM